MRIGGNILAPFFPTIVLFDPTLTFTEPVMVPETTMTLATSSLVTASVNWASVETVVVAPPFPPVVLWYFRILIKASHVQGNSPAILSCKPSGSNVSYRGSLGDVCTRGNFLILCWCWNCRGKLRNKREASGKDRSLHVGCSELEDSDQEVFSRKWLWPFQLWCLSWAVKNMNLVESPLLFIYFNYSFGSYTGRGSNQF